MGAIKKDKDKREITDLAIDIARMIDKKTFLTMMQAYMMQNMIQHVNVQLIPPPITAQPGHRECFIRYEIVPFELPTPEKPYDGETTDDLGSVR